MEIIGVEVNDVILPYVGNDNSTGHYRAFMQYCIDNYFDRIIISDTLQRRFRLTPNDPDFRRTIHYKRVEGHHGLYFSNWNGTIAKKRIIETIGEELGIDLFVHIFDINE